MRVVSARRKGRVAQTPEGTPFNVGVWVNGESVLAGLNPGDYSGGYFDSKLPPLHRTRLWGNLDRGLEPLQQKLQKAEDNGQTLEPKQIEEYIDLRNRQAGLAKAQEDEPTSG